MTKPVKCGKCVEMGFLSTVRAVTIWDTLHRPARFDIYWDEDGVQHRHDEGRNSMRYWCSDGHIWEESASRECDADGCEWKPPPTTVEWIDTDKPLVTAGEVAD